MSKRRDRDVVTRRYHFTHVRNLVSILDEGVIRVAESNVGSPHEGMPPVGEHVGPDVVWLTDLARPHVPLGLHVPPGFDPKTALQTGQDKSQTRITVEVPRAELFKWEPWAHEKGTHPLWFAVLADLCAKEHTFVIERPIPRSEWSAVHLLIRGEWVRVPTESDGNVVLDTYRQRAS